MTLCALGVVLAFLIGVGGTMVLWAACTVSGKVAENDESLREG